MKFHENSAFQCNESNDLASGKKLNKNVLFPITISKAEKEAWKRKAEENNLTLAEYIRVLMREGIAGVKQIEVNRLKETYETQVKELGTSNLQLKEEVDSLKNQLIQKIGKLFDAEDNRKTKPSIRIRTLKDLLGKEIEVVYTDKGIKERKSYENSLIEDEMNGMSSEQREKVKSLVMRDKDSLVVAIKKVKGNCGEEFEEYFKNDLKVLKWNRNA